MTLLQILQALAEAIRAEREKNQAIFKQLLNAGQTDRDTTYYAPVLEIIDTAIQVEEAIKSDSTKSLEDNALALYERLKGLYGETGGTEAQRQIFYQFDLANRFLADKKIPYEKMPISWHQTLEIFFVDSKLEAGAITASAEAIDANLRINVFTPALNENALNQFNAFKKEMSPSYTYTANKYARPSALKGDDQGLQDGANSSSDIYTQDTKKK